MEKLKGLRFLAWADGKQPMVEAASLEELREKVPDLTISDGSVSMAAPGPGSMAYLNCQFCDSALRGPVDQIDILSIEEVGWSAPNGLLMCKRHQPFGPPPNARNPAPTER